MNSKRSVLFFLLSMIVIVGLGVNIFSSQAVALAVPNASITVTTGADTVSNDGLCSLREAIRSANTDTAIGGCTAGNGSDIIFLDTGTYILSIAGKGEDAAFTGDLDITDDLEIRGKGVSSTFVSANGIDRVFHVAPGLNDIEVAFYNLTIEDGDVYDGSGGEEDASGGGGVLSNAHLVLDRVVVRDSEATRGGGVRVTETGVLDISNSVIQDNFAQIEGGGVYGDAPITLRDVDIVGNESNRGGGISCDLGCAFSELTVRQNQAEFGGGIYVDSIVLIENSTIESNVALNQGGGIYNEDDLTLTNVTLSKNYSQDQGSAIFSDYAIYLRNVTIYQNNSLPGVSGAVTNELGGKFELVNTIIADNFPQDCSSGDLGDLQSFGANMDSDSTCDLAHDTDRHNINPRLGVLQDNGGATLTHAPLSNSPAIDAGLNTSCAPIDQRGFPRPVDGNGDGSPICDIGAVELSPAGIFRLAPTEYQVDESVGTVQFTVSREGSLEGSVSVNYLTWEVFTPDWARQGDDYSEGVDYIGETGTFTWGDGDNSPKTITVEIVDDTYEEPDERFLVLLMNPTGGAAIVPANRQSEVTILENDIGGDPEPPDPERFFIQLPLVAR